MQPTRTRFGKSIFGGGPVVLIASSIVLGIGISLAFSLIAANVVFSENKSLAIALFLASMTPIMSVLMWALLVDRSTVKDAVDDPENSIESAWYSKAAEDTLHLGLVTCGVLGVVSVFVDYSVDLGTFTSVVVLFQFVVFMVSYLLRKRRDC